METQQRCPDCGAAWTEGDTCTERFHMMGFWELENPALWEVHHLMVLSYNLQHPHIYSPDGLKFSKGLLVDFLENGVTTQAVRQQNRSALDSGNRKFKVTGTPESYGKHAHPVTWTMTAADVIAGGVENYIDTVRAWAQSIYEALKASKNLE